MPRVETDGRLTPGLLPVADGGSLGKYGRNSGTLEVASGLSCTFPTKFREQRREEGLISASTPDRTLVDRLAHLRGTRCAHRPLSLVKGEATPVPFKTAMGNDAPCSTLQIGDDVLIAHVEDAAWR